MDFMSYIWLGVLLISIGVETVTLSLTAIWFMPASLVSMVLSFCHVNIFIQIVVFAVISATLLILTRPICRKWLAKRKDLKTNVDSLIGKEAIVVEEIQNLQGTGAVKVGGLVWSAKSKSGEVIAPDTVITISDINGVYAIVTPKENNNL